MRWRGFLIGAWPGLAVVALLAGMFHVLEEHRGFERTSARTLVCPEGTVLVHVSNVSVSYRQPRGAVAEEVPLYGCYPGQYAIFGTK